MVRKVGRKFLIAVLFFLCIPGLYSQTQSVDMPGFGIFSGNVKDTTGAPIPNATIGLTSQSNSFTTKTDKEGRYSIEVQPGDYTLKVMSPGFQIFEHRLIHVFGGSPGGENIILQISNWVCSPCIEPEPPPVELEPANSLTITLPLKPLPPLKLHPRNLKKSPTVT